MTGSELEALEGMQEFLARCADVKLIVELCPSILTCAGIRPERLLARVTSLQFEINVLLDDAIVPQTSVDLPNLLHRLARTGDYVNLLCIKGRSQELSIGDSPPAGRETERIAR